jgi:hypothetical protein
VDITVWVHLRTATRGQTSPFKYAMERQGQAQALDLATNFPTNGYLPPTNATTSQSQSQTIDPRLTQRVPVPPRMTSVPSNVSANAIPSFGSTQQVSQPPPPHYPLYTNRWLEWRGYDLEGLRASSHEGWGCIHILLISSFRFTYKRVGCSCVTP